MSQAASIQLSITSSTKCLPVVRSAVERLAKLEGFDPAEAHGIMLAIDEALANVIQHGYGGRQDQPITITLESLQSPDAKSGIAITVRDQGKQVDPTSICGRNLDEVRPGGLGVHLIRAVMDEVDYSCAPGGGMLLRMVKYAMGKKQETSNGGE